MNQPYALKGNIIELTLTSVLQNDILDSFKTDLMEYLREKLNNDLITIRGMINEEESGKKIYTNKEKFDYLAGKNPVLKELKSRLGLDTDY